MLLLVEVADSSLAYDRGPKLALYARHGVPEVWIVDLVGRAVEMCRKPGPEGYAESSRVTEGVATPSLVPGLATDLTALLEQLGSPPCGSLEVLVARIVSANRGMLV